MKNVLHRTRDDSIELESMLREQNKRLLSDQDREVHLATLAERNRIARDIHDNVGHLLSRAILLLGAISTINKDKTLAPQLELLSDTLDESMAKMRSSVHDLHDDSIDLEKNIREIGVYGELTEREREIASLIVDGFSNKQIADIYGALRHNGNAAFDLRRYFIQR